MSNITRHYKVVDNFFDHTYHLLQRGRGSPRADVGEAGPDPHLGDVFLVLQGIGCRLGAIHAP